MKPVSTAGVELEYKLTDKEGYVVSRMDSIPSRDYILKDPRIDRRAFEDEALLSQIEIRAPINGAQTITELYKNLSAQLHLAEQIAQEHGLNITPGSEYAAPHGEIDWSITKLEGYPHIFGLEKLEKLLHHSGFHYHISQIPGKELEQEHLLRALDGIVIATSSTSSIAYDGRVHENGAPINCYRVHITRNDVFDDPTLRAQLEDYTQSKEALNAKRSEIFTTWQERSGHSEEYFRKLGFSEHCTGYDPIRKKDHLGPTGTFEGRMGDSAPVAMNLAALALVKGVHDYVFRNDLPISINSSGYSGDYLATRNAIILPNYSYLKKLEKSAITYGFNDPLLHVAAYAHHLLPIARAGLPKEDRHFLAPLEQIVGTGPYPSAGKNTADKMIEYLIEHHNYNRGEKVNEEQAAAVNLWLLEQQQRDITCLDRIVKKEQKKGMQQAA